MVISNGILRMEAVLVSMAFMRRLVVMDRALLVIVKMAEVGAMATTILITLNPRDLFVIDRWIFDIIEKH